MWKRGRYIPVNGGYVNLGCCKVRKFEDFSIVEVVFCARIVVKSFGYNPLQFVSKWYQWFGRKHHVQDLVSYRNRRKEDSVHYNANPNFSVFEHFQIIEDRSYNAQDISIMGGSSPRNGGCRKRAMGRVKGPYANAPIIGRRGEILRVDRRYR